MESQTLCQLLQDAAALAPKCCRCNDIATGEVVCGDRSAFSCDAHQAEVSDAYSRSSVDEDVEFKLNVHFVMLSKIFKKFQSQPFYVEETRPGLVTLKKTTTGKTLKSIAIFCQDCGSIRERWLDYYAMPGTWAEAGAEGFLCLACLKKRLKRPLEMDDFDHENDLNRDIEPGFLQAINGGKVPSDCV